MNRVSTTVRVFADGGQALGSGEDAGDGEDCGRGSKEPYLESAAACSWVAPSNGPRRIIRHGPMAPHGGDCSFRS